ncbi:MAG: hypothetical protein AB7I50_14350 [Vicinamibacterales bacterium]
MSISGETTVFIKGVRQRTDAFIRGQQLTTVVDLETLTATVIDHSAKRAQIFRLESVSLVRGGRQGEVVVGLEPTGTTRGIAGLTCSEYRVAVGFEEVETRSARTPLIEGTVWIAPEGNGAGEVHVFYARARDRRVAVGDPRATRVDDLRSFALTSLHARASEEGVVCGMQIDLGDSATTREVASITSEVTKVSSSPVDENLFAVPAGYLVAQP